MVYTGQIFYRDRRFNGLKESGRLVEPDSTLRDIAITHHRAVL